VKEAKILIVDADESIRFTFERFLNKAGYGHIVTASNATEALANVQKKTFDLVISDIMLEGEKGPELLRSLRQAGVDCPVIMITGSPDLDSATNLIRLGAFDYIVKPINKKVLLRFTSQALRHRALQKEKIRLESENLKFRRYLEAVFQSVQDAIITVDPDLKIIQMNEKAMFWMLPEDDKTAAPPKTLDEISGEFGASCLADAIQVIKNRSGLREHRIEFTAHDGESRVISLNAAPIEDDFGTFNGVVVVARDITSSGFLPDRDFTGRFHGFVDSSPAMIEVFNLIQNVGKVDTTVLITGESGTGKELTAEALHAESSRRDRSLIKVDCASIPEELLESELFGHRKGAFTGADRDRPGRILQADGGTLFLDEIGDISSKLQLRLLRFLQERTFYPVGHDKPVQVDVRVITATNADLHDKVNRNIFREDLFYRLRVVEIHLPPLRARRESIPLLVEHFLRRFSVKLDSDINGISDQALDALVNHNWPGNVRELQHTIERACVLCTGSTLSLDCLPPEIRQSDQIRHIVQPHSAVDDTVAGIFEQDHGQLTYQPTRPGVQKPISNQVDEIVDALQKAGGNKAKASRLLGIDRSTLYRRMRRLKISSSAT